MSWYVVHTKPRQELRAQANLAQQGFEVYLPLIAAEHAAGDVAALAMEPLFPRYLFIRIDSVSAGLGVVRSTRGVSRLVSFGMEPAQVSDELVQAIRHGSPAPRALFNPGDSLRVTDGLFAGVEAIFQETNAERRAMVLIELLGKPVRVELGFSSLRRAV
jgi:transcriptional antiterminator RfaH